MDLVESLRTGLREAMRSRNQAAIRALRAALSAIADAEAVPAADPASVDPGSVADGPIAGASSGVGATEVSRRTLTPDERVAVVVAARDAWLATADEFDAVGRHPDAARLRAEAAALAAHLPTETRGEPLELLAAGRDADVFVHSPGWVLRRYRDGRSAHHEAELVRRVHALGFPAPAVADDHGPDVVMQRIDGPTLAAAILGGEIAVRSAGELLAGLHRRLHTLAWPGGQPLLHLDLHPQNVIVTADGPVVIDWTNARPGPAGLDVAVTAVILGLIVVRPEITGVGSELAGLVAAVGRDLLAAFTGAATPFVDQLDAAIGLRAADRNTTAAERDALARVAELVRDLAA